MQGTGAYMAEKSETAPHDRELLRERSQCARGTFELYGLVGGGAVVEVVLPSAKAYSATPSGKRMLPRAVHVVTRRTD